MRVAAARGRGLVLHRSLMLRWPKIRDRIMSEHLPQGAVSGMPLSEARTSPYDLFSPLMNITGSIKRP